jgi:hypothetical protein
VVRKPAPARELDEFCASVAKTTRAVRCVVCREDIPAGSSTPLAVQVFFDPEHERVSTVVASHARCPPSGVHRRPGLAQRIVDRRGATPAELDVSWCALDVASGHVGVVWEAFERAVLWQDDPATDAVTVPVAAYLEHGFSLVTPGQIETGTLPELPMLTEWVAKLGGDGTLEVLSPDGNAALSVRVDSEVLGLLREGMAEKGELIVLTGCYLHLDSEDRDAGLVSAASQGCLVGARIPARVN